MANSRKEYHDYVLKHILPTRFKRLGMRYELYGFETQVPVSGLVISRLHGDGSAGLVRFAPDAITYKGESYLLELKTPLGKQESGNIAYAMQAWEHGMAAHQQGALVAYMFGNYPLTFRKMVR